MCVCVCDIDNDHEDENEDEDDGTCMQLAVTNGPNVARISIAWIVLEPCRSRILAASDAHGRCEKL